MASLEIFPLPKSSSLLDGQTVIVTGAGSAGPMPGVGAACALRAAQAGADVALIDLNAERAAYTASCILEATGRSALVLVADITDASSVAGAVASVVDHFGRLDVLVNSAGIAPDESTDSSLATWDRVFDVNLRAAKIMLDAVLPSMRERSSGAVVNISSLAATRAGGGAAYSASKAALEALTRSVAFTEGPNGIRANAVSPGHLLSPMGIEGANGLGSDGGTMLLRRRRASASVLRVEGTAWDVADATLFLSSPGARFITGHTLHVDGGAGAALPLAMWQSIAEASAHVGD